MNDDNNTPVRKRPLQGNIDGFITPKAKIAEPTENIDHLSSTTASDSIMEDMTKPRAYSSSSYGASMLNTTLPNPKYAKKVARIKPKKSGWWRNRNRWSWKQRIGISVTLLIIAAIGAGGWDAWQLYHKVNHISVGNLTASVGGAENILIAGSTNRCNLTVQNAEWGFCSQGVTGINSDIIFIVHLVPKTHTVSLLSIPRDTFVPNARSGAEAFKIDAALYEGPTQLVSAVEQDFGIPIQHYAEVGFDGFVNIVNAVGGIKMDFPEPVYDSESYLKVTTSGCKILNGVEALQVVRARHLQYEPPGLDTSDVNLWPQEAESDIARIARTHEFLRVLASTVVTKGLGNPITDQKLINAIAPQVQIDKGFSTSAMLQLAEELHGVNINSVPQYTLPIVTTGFGSYEYEGENMGDVVFPVEAIDQQVIDDFLGTTSSIDTMTGNPLPEPSDVTVNVVNGSGTPDQASQTTSALQALGFDMVGTPGTSTPVSDQAQETVVNYASSQTEGDAEAVAKELTGYVILSQNSSMVTPGSEVTVVTGTDLSVDGTSASSSSASSTTGSSTSQTSPTASVTSGSANFSAPSSANQALSPWDPRACTASQPVETTGIS